MAVQHLGGRRSLHDTAGPFRAKALKDEEDLLDSINRYRVHLGWSSRQLDQAVAGAGDLTTILNRGARTKTLTIFKFLDAMGLELVIRPKETAKKPTRLQRAIAAKKNIPESDDPAAQAEV